ncbi:MAG: TIGR01777 family protein [Verrucomicrobia bacterium]|nr:TIGR01777 family protein [Verrucomicrobiota bacterium]
MREEEFSAAMEVPVPCGELFDWHAADGALERLLPPFQRVEIRRAAEAMKEGETVVLRLRAGPFFKDWVARLEEVRPPASFVDVQEKGPFRAWRHEHRMEVLGETRSQLEDKVRWRLPFGLERIGPLRKRTEAELRRLFAFRHGRMREDLDRRRRWGTGEGRRVLISGASGLIGARLSAYLRTLGFTVAGLTRGAARDGWIHWDPANGELALEDLEGWDAVVHLAGEPIADGRWTEERKKRLRDSRIASTRLLVERMRAAKEPPKVFLCASGVNFYAAKTTFLHQVCRDWEAEAVRAEEAGIRTIRMRTGIVLDPAGGALAKMLPAFRLGLGGPIGSGRQGFPFIGMDDLLDLYYRGIQDEEWQGVIDAVSPAAGDQRSFSRVLGRVLRRPAFLPLPATGVKILFGEMGKETLLADLPTVPENPPPADHPFRHAEAEDCLRFLLGRAMPRPQLR